MLLHQHYPQTQQLMHMVGAEAVEVIQPRPDLSGDVTKLREKQLEHGFRVGFDQKFIPNMVLQAMQWYVTYEVISVFHVKHMMLWHY